MVQQVDTAPVVIPAVIFLRHAVVVACPAGEEDSRFRIGFAVEEFRVIFLPVVGMSHQFRIIFEKRCHGIRQSEPPFQCAEPCRTAEELIERPDEVRSRFRVAVSQPQTRISVFRRQPQVQRLFGEMPVPASVEFGSVAGHFQHDVIAWLAEFLIGQGELRHFVVGAAGTTCHQRISVAENAADRLQKFSCRGETHFDPVLERFAGIVAPEGQVLHGRKFMPVFLPELFPAPLTAATGPAGVEKAVVAHQTVDA